MQECFCILLGDFNARMSELQTPHFSARFPRLSSDPVTSIRGRELLSAFSDLEMAVVNGTNRFEASSSTYTFHGGRGNSVINYLIANAHALEAISDFRIAPKSSFSDHSCLTVKVCVDRPSIQPQVPPPPPLHVPSPALLNDAIERLCLNTISDTPSLARRLVQLYGPVTAHSPPVVAAIAYSTRADGRFCSCVFESPNDERGSWRGRAPHTADGSLLLLRSLIHVLEAVPDEESLNVISATDLRFAQELRSLSKTAGLVNTHTWYANACR